MDGDSGANTGGMGAYCPCPLITESDLATVADTILQKAVNGLKMEKSPFIGKISDKVTKTRPFSHNFLKVFYILTLHLEVLNSKQGRQFLHTFTSYH
jgi:hypothetical protein